MERPRAAVHRTIIVVDVEGFGDARRTLPHQLTIREGLYRVLREAFGNAGVAWSACHREDRGDAVFVLAPADIPKALFVESVPYALVTALRAHNASHRADEERIRLRMALHAGEVAYDEHGVTSSAVNLAFRLLDATPLKAVLAGSPGVLALITSAWFFDDVVRHCPVAEPATYRPVRVAVKETTTVGWICLPDHPYPSDPATLSSLPPAPVALTSADTRKGKQGVADTPELPAGPIADDVEPALAEAGSHAPTITMTATVSASGRVYQAARDQHITEGRADEPQRGPSPGPTGPR